MLSLVKCNGYIAFSLKYGQGEEIVFEKLDAPRFFKYYNEKELQTILANDSIEIISLQTTSNKKWIYAIITKNNYLL